MSGDSKGSGIALKALVAVAILAAAAMAVVNQMRPIAKVVAATSGPVKNIVEGDVEVTPETRQPVVSDIGGRLLDEDFNLVAGKTVKKGDPLARTDSAEISSKLNGAKIDREALAAQMGLDSPYKALIATKETELKNFTELLKGSRATQQDVNKAEGELQALHTAEDLGKITTKKNLDTLDNEIAQLTRQVGQSSIKAQFDGEISEVFLKPGASTRPNDPIAELISVEHVVEAKINQENLAKVKVGQKATVELQGQPKPFDATVKKVFNTADSLTGRYRIHLTLDAPADVLKVGLTGNVHITVDEHAAKAIVPRQALTGTHINVVNGGKVERRAVKVGFTNFDEAEILEGVQAGDLVIVEDPMTFRNGQRVKTEVVGTSTAK